MQPVPGGMGSDAVGINDLSEVVGRSDSGNVNTPHAVLWNGARVGLDLGVLAGGTCSSGFAINVFRTVVGNGDCTGVRSHAFVWSRNHGMQDLNALIPANSGWELQGPLR